jgi:hypothetical protein
VSDYNLTENQKELLRILVEQVRKGAEEPILVCSTFGGDTIVFRSGENLEGKGDVTGDLGALCESGLMSFRWSNQGNELYSIKQTGYEAVDNDFQAPSEPIGTQVSIGAIIQGMIGGNVKAIGTAQDKVAGEETEIPKSEKVGILFLAADPTDASRLRLGEELREIQEKLQLARLRDRFELNQRMSVRPTDITQALLDWEPQIVHFSGHGTAAGALCFEDRMGETHPVQPDALAALFEQFADQVNCVVLNACYSEIQANAIAKHIDYIVGMNQDIDDQAAIAFSIGFYQALGAGHAVEKAYQLGCVQIRLQDVPEHLTPVLAKKELVQQAGDDATQVGLAQDEEETLLIENSERMPKNYGIKILSPSGEEPTVKIGKKFRLEGTFEETPPRDRVRLFKLPQIGNYWPLINIEIDFNYGDYREKKWRADIPVLDNKPGYKVEYIIAILGDEGLTQWIDYKNLPNGEREGIPVLFDGTIVCDRKEVTLVSE